MLSEDQKLRILKLFKAPSPADVDTRHWVKLDPSHGTPFLDLLNEKYPDGPIDTTPRDHVV